MVLTPLAVQMQFWPPISVPVKPYRTDKSCISSRRDKLPNHATLRAFLFPLPLKVNFYATPETNPVESGAEGTYGLLHPLFSISPDHW